MVWDKLPLLVREGFAEWCCCFRLSLRAATVVNLLCLLTALAMAISSFSLQWSVLRKTDTGHSGVVSWATQWEYSYFLTSYLDVFGNQEHTYNPAQPLGSKDNISSCNNTSSLWFISLAVALVSLSLIMWVLRGFSLSESPLVGGFAHLFSSAACLCCILAASYWTSSCHTPLAELAAATTRETAVAEISSEARYGSGWWMVALGCVPFTLLPSGLWPLAHKEPSF
mmetsp:Transcript_43209/g.84688  ORF Transcript_43209/g.84688 Transcript_43209/m.84688 type:complete len:226 (-) Transcript_43209:32-709(-)